MESSRNRKESERREGESETRKCQTERLEREEESESRESLLVGLKGYTRHCGLMGEFRTLFTLKRLAGARDARLDVIGTQTLCPAVSSFDRGLRIAELDIFSLLISRPFHVFPLSLPAVLDVHPFSCRSLLVSPYHAPYELHHARNGKGFLKSTRLHSSFFRYLPVTFRTRKYQQQKKITNNTTYSHE